MEHWHQKTSTEVVEQLGTDAANGLADDAAVARRLAEFGLNELVETHGRSPWQILWEQLEIKQTLLRGFCQKGNSTRQAP